MDQSRSSRLTEEVEQVFTALLTLALSELLNGFLFIFLPDTKRSRTHRS